MPEGDTTWRAARTLRGVLAGRTVTGFASPLVALEAAADRLRLVGSRVEAVEARGKHLLFRFSTGASLHAHQGMHGSWHVYRVGSPWRRGRAQVRAVLSAGDVEVVSFGSPLVELLGPGAGERHRSLTRLGPDVLSASLDAGGIRAGLRRLPGTEIGQALLDQTTLSGVGNVYKSEVLFLCGVNPFAEIGGLDDATLDRVVETAAAQMRRNLDTSLRRTTAGTDRERFWVYHRGGKPCRRCATPVRRRAQGPDRRSTWWCPTCQRERTS